MDFRGFLEKQQNHRVESSWISIRNCLYRVCAIIAVFLICSDLKLCVLSNLKERITGFIVSSFAFVAYTLMLTNAR